jgi:hypothetical protein
MTSARRRRPTPAAVTTLVAVAFSGAVAVLGACATGTLDTYGPADGAASESSVAETGGKDSAAPAEGAATQDAPGPADTGVDAAAAGDGGADGGGGDGSVDATSPDASEGGSTDGSATDAATETGPSDAGPGDAAGDGSNCSVGPGADYQATCTSCSISATCLLHCASCTTKAQTQNPNPTLQLLCPGTMAVQNIDGVLTCQ